MASSPSSIHHAAANPNHGLRSEGRLISKISNLLIVLLNQMLQARTHFYNLYLITIDDTPTFVVPNTIFGVSSALSNSMVNTTESTTLLSLAISGRLFKIMLHTAIFNWTNLLVFDLANQRQSGDEDAHNKPWRPVPSGRLNSNQIRYLLMATIPVVLAYNHFILGVGPESCLLAVLTWLYNDLGGGDDNWLVRNFIIGCAFGVYNLGSMKVAASILATAGHAFGVLRVEAYAPVVSPLGYSWTAIISLVIFTTMHVQDLKDVKGDTARGRRSAPIVLGRRAAGWTIAFPVVFWAAICPLFWRSPILVAWVPGALGLCVAWRCVCISGKRTDRRTWQLWCAWTAVLYILPLLSADN